MRKPCVRCGHAFEAKRSARFCSSACHDASDADRFWSKVDRSAGPDACWPWLGSVDPNGYGWFSIGGRMRQSHRVALELALHRTLERLELSLHMCDNPTCCNPHVAHVHLGTHKMNHDEMRERGRMRPATGAANRSTKLTPSQVQEIRSLRAQWTKDNPERMRVAKGSPISVGALAARYGVSGQAIKQVLCGATHANAGVP